MRFERAEDAEDFARPRVAVETRLLEDRLAVVHDLEASLAGGYQLHRRLRILAFDFGRQTGGPWLVVSKRAVFDRDSHGTKLTRLDGQSRQ
jgi:hypothetical protein